jgi:hypothetical protein
MRVAFPKKCSSGSDSAFFQGQLGLLDGNGSSIRLLRRITAIASSTITSYGASGTLPSPLN